MTQRPVVQVQRSNQSAALRGHLMAQLPRLQALPGVIGITLNGGLSRGYGDHLSEIDVTLYLTSSTYAAWQRKQSPIAMGITVFDGQLYDVKLADYDAELAAQWSSDACWDASYAEILYDPNGQIAQLYGAQLAIPPLPEEGQGLMMNCWWHFQLAGDIWLHRGDALQGHYMMNQAVVALTKALFVANREWIPHEKWLFHMSRSLAWQPPAWNERLEEAFHSGAGDMDALRRRQIVIATLWQEIDCYLIDTYWPGLPVHGMQRSFYNLLATLNRTGVMSRADWERAGGNTLYNVDPFHKVVSVDEESIYLNRQQLLDLTPSALYSWHYAVAEALREHSMNSAIKE